MKLTWAVLALASASDDGENKKYVNKDNFMDAPTPDWWTNFPAEKRAKTYFKKSPRKFLEAWIPEEYKSDWELRFRQLNTMRTEKLNKLIEKNECGRDAVAGGATDDDEENERRRRSVVNMLASQDLSVDEVAIIDAEEAGLAPRKIRGEDLRKDINKMFGNMARYVVEEVLRTQNAKKCNRMGYRMLYRIERLRVASMYFYCRRADNGFYPENDLCNWNTETMKPRWRVKKNGELAPHPHAPEYPKHYSIFDWSEDKIGNDFPSDDSAE